MSHNRREYKWMVLREIAYARPSREVQGWVKLRRSHRLALFQPKILQDKAWQGKARQGMARQGIARQGAAYLTFSWGTPSDNARSRSPSASAWAACKSLEVKKDKKSHNKWTPIAWRESQLFTWTSSLHAVSQWVNEWVRLSACLSESHSACLHKRHLYHPPTAL